MAESSAPILYRYRARERGTGRLRLGEKVGPDPYTVRANLRRLGLDVEALTPLQAGRQWPRFLRPLQRTWQDRQRRRRRIGRADLFDGLATMLAAGLPMDQSLQSLLASPVRRGEERQMLRLLVEQVRAGTTLADAAAGFPSWFDRLDVAMLRSGQDSGDLPAVLLALGEHHQRGSALGHKLFSALSYPSFLLIMALAVLIFLSTQTLPELVGLILDAGHTPPTLTMAVISLGQGLAYRWWLLALLLAGAWPLVALGLRRLPPQSRLRRFLNALPWARAGHKIRIAEWSRTLARLLRSGLPLAEALEVVSDVAVRSRDRQLLQEAVERIKQGGDLSAVLAGEGLMDAEFAQLVQLGEQSGELAAMLDRVADRYARGAERSIDRLTALLEPAAIVCMAIMIGLVVYAAILPLLQLTSIF